MSLIKEAEAKYKTLDPKIKNSLIIGVGLVVTFFLFFGGSNSPVHQGAPKSTGFGKPASATSLLAGTDDKTLDEAKLRQRLDAYEESLDALQDTQVKLITALDKTTTDQKEGQAKVTVLESKLLKEQQANEALNSQLEAVNLRAMQAEKTAQQAIEDASNPRVETRIIQQEGASVGDEQSKIGNSRQVSKEELISDGNPFETPPSTGETSRTKNGSSNVTATTPVIQTISENFSELATEEYIEAVPEASFTIPAGSIISAVLVTGVDAPTNSGARRDTTPALIRIQDDAIMANYWRLDIKECHALITGYGSMSDERYHAVGQSITCITKSGEIIDPMFPGYITGLDGSEGIRGNLVMREGALLFRATIAGMMETLSNVLGGAFQTAEVDSLDDLANLATGAGANGMGNGFSRLSEYWIDMAESVFPVIEVKSRIPVEFITTGRIDLRAPSNQTQTAQNNMEANSEQ